MTKILPHLLPSGDRLVSTALMAGAASLASVLLGWVPAVDLSTRSLQFGDYAYAQAVSEADIRNYARAAWDIEQLRQTYAQNVQRVLQPNEAVPSVTCDQSDDVNSLRRPIREEMVRFCRESAAAAERNSLTIERFNAIMQEQSRNRDLSNRIRQEYIRLQQRP